MDPLLELSVERNDSFTVVTAVGEIDLVSAPELRDCLTGVEGCVVVDLTGVTFLDSTGISVLAASHERLRVAGGTLALRRPPASVRRTLEIVGLADWIEE